MRLRRTTTAALTAGILLACTGPATALAEPALNRANPVQRSLDHLVREAKFPAALAAVSVDGRQRSYAAGVRDRATGAPAVRDSQVRIGSNTKTFIAVAVLQLVAEGKVELDAPIERYLPNLVRGKGIDGNQITVRQLLQHTSGLPNYTKHIGVARFPEFRDRYREPRELLDIALSHPADFAPGTSWSYSNTGYLLAGLLIQRVTGRPVAEVVTTKVIDRAGLRETYWPRTGEMTIRGAHPKGYGLTDSTKPDSPVLDVTVQDTGWAGAAGELVGTPSDLNRFYAALLGGRLLPPAQLAEMRKTVPAKDFVPGVSYGLGIMRTELSCGRVAWSHGGDIPGYETRNGSTEDGRAVSIAVTALPGTFGDAEGSSSQVLAAVDTALCAS
ncbi:serine hydrolase [Crossiella sp. CA-258035]|uniref:serine hydrolase domain-containing protein n=1 Tax=Crossiella sp. CA-258035 TaxID=2981138 RepID=UPI0024BC537C|nr:serine hydrolase domain-containing protein [Crossiella sp. CA-258035]WHT22416.1 serine hydrolase [Crossiella sp. CA-258035]